ncbi:rod shape-determining protein MreD [Amaricoccus solimangrovi]|uniref:Rod shape-determining protein MreD n=1 Tax=Amaricoccus solimangrovi TaxID=2589815 RepID=A0A501WXY4_9RHOB|nr:rod shape-determining protein MreD [Amaricoccus solimangrovi]TPE53592.1 rod shape-determining protein MreD [Amaricoccus solimangrovi]
MRSGRWSRRALLPLLGIVAIHAPLVPVAPGSGAAMPDLLWCLVLAFVARAPDAAPAAVIVGLGLLADLMLSRPPGLGALGLLIASEIFRAPDGAARGWSPPREWLFAAAAFAATILATALAERLTLGPGLAALRGHVVATVLAYPFVALGVGWLLGQRPARSGTR